MGTGGHKGPSEAAASCVACGGGRLSRLGRRRWSFWGVEYGLARCRSCGCAQTRPTPTPETLARVYRTSFDYDWYRDHYWAKARDARIRVAEYRPWLGRRVLDYGGGLGYLSEAAREAGLTARTYDPFAGGHGKPRGRYDAVVALHVLEHVARPGAMLSEIGRYLRPGGHLIIAVPNYDGQGYRALGMRWVWAQAPLLHVTHFTRRGLVRLLERHGFTVVDIGSRERWDANALTDIKHRLALRALGRLREVPLLRRSALFRAGVSRLVSTLRFWGLGLARSATGARGAELQAVAVKRGGAKSTHGRRRSGAV